VKLVSFGYDFVANERAMLRPKLEEVARRLSGRQVYVSRLERRSDVKLSTLRDCVRALGGDLQLMVIFPDGAPVRLRHVGTSGRKRRGSAPKSKLKRIA
jgi:hypothetical protein